MFEVDFTFESFDGSFDGLLREFQTLTFSGLFIDATFIFDPVYIEILFSN